MHKIWSDFVLFYYYGYLEWFDVCRITTLSYYKIFSLLQIKSSYDNWGCRDEVVYIVKHMLITNSWLPDKSKLISFFESSNWMIYLSDKKKITVITNQHKSVLVLQYNCVYVDFFFFSIFLWRGVGTGPYQAVLCLTVPLVLVFAGLNDRKLQLIKYLIVSLVFLVFFYNFQEFVVKCVPANLKACQ